MGARFELGMLGPLEVRVDGGAPLPLGGLRQRALLAVLALRANEVVSTDRLIDELWGEHPPAKAVHTVQVFVSRLRGILGPAGTRLMTRPPGYVLEVGADELDSDRCQRLYEAARSALAVGNADGAATLLGEALALWRGSPLSDFTYEPFAQAAIARLEELRVGCQEELIDAELSLGRHAEVVSTLEALVREHPFRERPRGQLMLALYRCGRQADALEEFQRARRMLVEQLAVEPGAELRELEQAILRQDESLAAPVIDSPAAVDSLGPVGVAPETERAASKPDGHVVSDEAAQVAMVRKTATVLVSRLTPWGEVDPEIARRAMAAAREQAEEIVTKHGGAFVGALGGDLVWVFGVPLVKEDDALRALRAADELRSRLSAWTAAEPCRLTTRFGVATGEVVAETAGDVFGEPLSRALGLTQAAAPGEVLLGETTRRLALSVIRAEPVADSAAWRLLGLVAEFAPTLRLQTPMVGRDDELSAGLAAFERTMRSGQAHLLTVVGDPGIGKSRYAQALVSSVNGRATVLTGRCLSYGEGVAFWPLREAVSQGLNVASRDELRELLGAAEDAEAVADIVATTLGFAATEITPEQVPWAFRRLLELLSTRRPVVLVIEDAHWAEPALLELIDYLTDWLIAPVLLLCLARPELLDVRPGWGGGHARVNSVVLSPLAEEDARFLLNQHVGRRVLTPEESATILGTAEGNPLFVEQLLQASSEDPQWDQEGPIPATIESLLAARLDRLGPGERAYIERAALIGREFWPAAVVKLLPPEAQRSASAHLSGLVRRGFIHPDRSAIAGEEQLRFHHILIRDVAYRSTPKALRGELHEKFADWLTARGEAYDEFVGYHLERAFRYRCEVQGIDDPARAVADRAVESLSAAGRRALGRGDTNAAVNLLRTAADLLQASGRRRPDVLLDLGSALSESGDFSDAERVLKAVVEQAPPETSSLRTRALIELSDLRSRADPTAHVDELLEVADQAIRVFEQAGDEGGLARAWLHIGWAHWMRSRGAEMEPALERALAHAERADERRERSTALMYLARCYVYGPRPVKDAIPRCHKLLQQSRGDVPTTAHISALLAVLEAMDGRFHDARNRWRESKQRLVDLGLSHTVARVQMAYGFVELLANSPELAEPDLAEACTTFQHCGDQSRLSSAAAILARLLYASGRYQQSDNYTRLAEAAASEDDIEPQIFWRGTRAKILARDGQTGLADELSDAAVALARDTDFLLHYAAALSDRAEVMVLLGRATLAVRYIDDSIEVYERKGIGGPGLAALRSLHATVATPVVSAPSGGGAG